jgi:hypothetical protein
MPEKPRRSQQPRVAGPPSTEEQPKDSEPRFGGSPVIPPPEVFAQARENWPAWYKILRKAYEQFAADPKHAGVYADPSKGSGATIQQIWLLFTVWGTQPYCLLARPLPAASTERITRLVSCSPADLIETLKQIHTATGSIGVNVAYHDGKTGHCIMVYAYDVGRDRFIYHDPWPARSLLAKENNPVGIDAQPEGSRWSVTAKELESVVVAAFIFPVQWARVHKQAFDLFYDVWTKTEFFKFFNLQQLEERMEEGHTVRAFAPAAFTRPIALLVECAQSGKITRASLHIDDRWLIDNFMLAIDFIKSFVLCFAPPPDASTYGKIAEVLWSLRDPRNMLKVKDSNPDESQAIRCVHALMGSRKSADVITDLARLTIRSGDTDMPHRVLEYDLM